MYVVVVLAEIQVSVRHPPSGFHGILNFAL